MPFIDDIDKEVKYIPELHELSKRISSLDRLEKHIVAEAKNGIKVVREQKHKLVQNKKAIVEKAIKE